MINERVERYTDAEARGHVLLYWTGPEISLTRTASGAGGSSR